MYNLQAQIDDIKNRLDEIEDKLSNPSWIKSTSARMAGSKTSPAKAKTARENKLRSLADGKNPGGRPRKTISTGRQDPA